MNPAAVLSLISNLYEQVLELNQRKRELEARIAELEGKPGSD